jgi:hypothetical protein
MSNRTINYNALVTGNAGNPEAWDIITSTAHDFTGKIVAAFLSLDDDGGTFTEMEEETQRARNNQPAVSAAVAAKYLTYTYPKEVIFEGRYSKLVPTAGKTFKVYFLI